MIRRMIHQDENRALLRLKRNNRVPIITVLLERRRHRRHIIVTLHLVWIVTTDTRRLKNRLNVLHKINPRLLL